ncbi:ADAMTS-like protein 5 isoform X4 [Pogoniulus pusillus]|uniref:ADAMTS-like protein 5 isoform X4 n=1 Tax=Pogoniulus pusillus TaxID=488313 RepID=UPI0030B9A426
MPKRPGTPNRARAAGTPPRRQQLHGLGAGAGRPRSLRGPPRCPPRCQALVAVVASSPGLAQPRLWCWHGTGLQGRSSAQVTPGSIGSASSRTVPAARCPSVPCSAPSTTTSPCWAQPLATTGCPSTESVGCDGILGSGAQPDACGQCGGGHRECHFVHRLFQGAEPSSGYFGYMNVTKIPAGATHVKVTDKSRNYLALMRSDGRYVLNGDWAIAWPGPYQAAGTQLLYTRTPDGTETLEVPGPTDEDLQLMVLLQEPNPGIEYQFWLPRGHTQRGRASASPLRQPQPRGAGSPPPPEPPVTPAPLPPPRAEGIATEPPPRSPPGQSGARAAAGRCGRCRPAKGRSQRIWHFCHSDFGGCQGWEGGMDGHQGTYPAQAGSHPLPFSLPGQDPGTALGGAGDSLRGGGENSVPAALPAGGQGVPVGAQHLRLPPAPGGGRVPADGLAPRQPRADPQPRPAAPRRLRPALDAPRGAAGTGGGTQLPPAPAALSPLPCRRSRQQDPPPGHTHAPPTPRQRRI